MAGLSGILGEAITIYINLEGVNMLIKKVTSKDTQKPDGQEEVKTSNETETDIYDEDLKEEEREENMSFKEGGRTYYRAWAEANAVRRKGDRIYYDPYLRAYYIVRPKKRAWWDIF